MQNPKFQHFMRLECYKMFFFSTAISYLTHRFTNSLLSSNKSFVSRFLVKKNKNKKFFLFLLFFQFFSTFHPTPFSLFPFIWCRKGFNSRPWTRKSSRKRVCIWLHVCRKIKFVWLHTNESSFFFFFFSFEFFIDQPTEKDSK